MTDNKQTKQGELIPGMTDVINHIKKLEKENKELKEVNKTLNNYNEANIKLRQEREDENNILRDLLQNRMPATCIAETTYQPILDENEKLKEQNNKLLLKETKTHNENVSLKSEIKELKEERDGEAEYIIETKIEDGDLFTNIYVENIEEQLEQQQKWFEEINELIGAKSEDPTLCSVAEYVKGMKIVDNELSKARKYERFLEYKLEQENIDYLIPDNYEEKDYDGSSEEEDN